MTIAETRKRLLKLGKKHYGTRELADHLKVSASVVEGWLDGKDGDMPDRKFVALVGLIDAKGGLGDES